VQTRPTCQRCFGDYLRPAASMHLHVTSQTQAILVTSSLASEVIRLPMAHPFDYWNFHLRLVASRLALRFQIASWWEWVPRCNLCRSARSRSLGLQRLVLCTVFHLSIPHLWSGGASWPMDRIRNTAESICFTQPICRQWLCNPASFVSLSQRGRKPSIRTDGDASKLASSCARPGTGSYRLPTASVCGS
jgi:hypothetical protein